MFQGYANYDYNYDFGDSHTGDPQRDEYNRQHYKPPELVKKFLHYFKSAVNEGLIFELQNIYENT